MSDNAIMRPADPTQHASGTAGLIESPAPPEPVAFPWKRAVVVIVVAATSISSPLLGSFTQSFAIAIMALGIARGANKLFAGVCIVGSAAVAGAITASSGVDATWVGASVLGAALTALLGMEQWRAARPDPQVDVNAADAVDSHDAPQRELTLAEQMAQASGAPAPVLVETSWPEPRIDRGITYATYTWLIAAIVLIAMMGVSVGTQRISHSMQSNVRKGFAGDIKDCAPGGIFAHQKKTCDELVTMRTYLLKTSRDHAPSILTIFAALSVVGGAWLSHIIVTSRNRALSERGWNIATRPSYKLRQLEFHWSWAYVGVVGIVAMIAARSLDAGVTREWTFAAGAGLATVAGQVIAMHGVGVVAWFLTRRPLPGWYRVFLVITTVFFSPFVIGAILLAGALDMQFRFRRRLLSLPTAA